MKQIREHKYSSKRKKKKTGRERERELTLACLLPVEIGDEPRKEEL
jgi:hypothetical protein